MLLETLTLFSVLNNIIKFASAKKLAQFQTPLASVPNLTRRFQTQMVKSVASFRPKGVKKAAHISRYIAYISE